MEPPGSGREPALHTGRGVVGILGEGEPPPPQFLVWTPAELGHVDSEGQAGEPWSCPHPPHPGPLCPAPKQIQVSWTVKEQNGRLVPSGAVLSGPMNSVQFVRLKSWAPFSAQLAHVPNELSSASLLRAALLPPPRGCSSPALTAVEDRPALLLPCVPPSHMSPISGPVPPRKRGGGRGDSKHVRAGVKGCICP